jgi:hypothetical protein
MNLSPSIWTVFETDKMMIQRFSNANLDSFSFKMLFRILFTFIRIHREQCTFNPIQSAL